MQEASMRRVIILAATVAALLTATVAALSAQTAAQGSCNDVKRYFTKPPKLGEWADLQLEGAQGKPVVMRLGFVDREQRGGQQYYRMQMTMTGRDGMPHIMQLLTPWGPDVLTKDADTEIIMKMGDRPAMVMPIQRDNDQMGLADLRKKCAEIEFVGEETIEVPAGKFETRHYTGPEGDSWMSMDVPGWHLVKMVTKKGRTMFLVARGDGFTNEITEKPVDMKAMMGPGLMKQRMPKDTSTEEAK
jgi:hypothetical protein